MLESSLFEVIVVLRAGAVRSRFLCDGSGEERGERWTALGGLYADDLVVIAATREGLRRIRKMV